MGPLLEEDQEIYGLMRWHVLETSKASWSALLLGLIMELTIVHIGKMLE